MHGRTGEERKRSRHMWTGPSRGNSAVAGDVSPSSSSLSSANSFYKDGRKISVGDCALFKPPQDSPPFIGIIRWLTCGKENNLKLGVNWLYRPSEVKLGKGILLEAAPNEIFYSFHKDEIPAASLLHLCKVAFLPKGVELPSGICSFVCRRVYDITNKCLWWLTDQDYIDERQEEVDQLLYRTRTEMHATVQPGGRSPKPMNGPTSTSQLKSASDSVQNSASSFPSHVKGKKRERGDQSSEPVKRERSMKMDDGESGNCKPESVWKSEIAKFTEKGGVVDSEGVEKLVQLMIPERSESRIDLVGRSLLASVVAATDKFDCLSQFVQLRGLPVFDEWLQEVHKGKIGDGGSPKDGDKSIDDFLLVLLRALDKLPVNLHALQMCNIGKSVNHLRSHKNLEIQRKARSLVDTWKKRVEAEMDAKSGANPAVHWPTRQRIAEASHGGNRHSGGSSDVAMKSSVAQLSAAKTTPVKLVSGESISKSASVSLASMKSTPSPASVGNNLKEGQPRNMGVSGASDPLTTAREEKSSSSSQSHNNSQSCSSDHAKTAVVSGKEDARSSTAGSIAVNKTISGSSRHRKSVNGFSGQAVSAVQRETGSTRSSSHKNPGSEKLSQSSMACDKAVDVPVAEGSSHKLIVKIPNRGRSPAQSVSGGSLEDPLVMNSRASSPVLSEKIEQFDRNLKEKSDACCANIGSDVNTESLQNNDFREVLPGSDERDGSPATVPEEEQRRTSDDTKKLVHSSSSLNEHNLGNSHDASFKSINALIESCKYSEANASMSVVDDVGMNLLASVAAGEMSKSDMFSPTDSSQVNNVATESSCAGNDSRLKSSPGDDIARDQSHSINGEPEKNGIVAAANSVVNRKDIKATSLSVENLTGEPDRSTNPSSMDVLQTAEPSLESRVKLEETSKAIVVAVPCMNNAEKTSNDEGKESVVENAGSRMKVEDTSTEVDVNSSSAEVKNDAVEGSSLCRYSEVGHENEANTNEEQNNSMVEEQKPLPMTQSELAKGASGEVQLPSSSGKDMISESVNEMTAENTGETEGKSHCIGKPKSEPENNIASAVAYPKDEVTEENLKGNQANEHSGGPSPRKKSPANEQEAEVQLRSRGSMLTSVEADEADCTSSSPDAAPLCAAAGSDMGAKVEFDLNEGFNADEGKFGEPNNIRASGSVGVQLVSPLPVAVSSVSSSLPASITVAAAAKGWFVPPEDLLRNKVELGWKGSAATSAFRPAEPRKVMEMSVGTNNTSLSDTTAAKASRPPLDFDLNVPDERVLEDLASCTFSQNICSVASLANHQDLARDDVIGSTSVRSSGGLDLDLNRVDEPSDVVNQLTTNSHRLDMQFRPAKVSSGGHLNGEGCIRRDFDLNDGPLDDVGADPSPFSQQPRNNTPSQPAVSGLRINNTEMGNFSSWFPQGNPYPPVTIQPILPDRGEQPFPIVASGGPQRMLATPTGSNTFSTDIYRGSVLSSSPAVPFPSTPFQYHVFPFGTNFPLPSAGSSTSYVDSSPGGRLCFPAVPSQVLAPAVPVPSHFPRSYAGLPEGNNNVGAESSRKWGRQGLDLNAGPLSTDIEGRDDTSLVARQLSAASSQALAEEQSRMYQMAGGSVLKRKEPEGGWDGYKQLSWR